MPTALRRRAVDSTVLVDAVATQDTLTQRVSATGGWPGRVPGAAEKIAALRTGHGYSKPDEPKIDGRQGCPSLGAGGRCERARGRAGCRWPRRAGGLCFGKREQGVQATGGPAQPGAHHFSHTWLDRGGAEGDLMELNGWTSPQMLRRYGASARSARARRSYDRIMADPA